MHQHHGKVYVDPFLKPILYTCWKSAALKLKGFKNPETRQFASSRLNLLVLLDRKCLLIVNYYGLSWFTLSQYFQKFKCVHSWLCPI